MSERQVSRILVARDETRLNTLAARLRAETSRSVDILPTDLAAPSDLLRVEHRPRQDPSIGMLVNNAGVAVAGPMHGSDVDRLTTTNSSRSRLYPRLQIGRLMAAAAKLSGSRNEWR